MANYSRADWDARRPDHPPGRLGMEDPVGGLAFHWPAHTHPIPRAQIPGRLRDWQDWHMDGHGWSDLAYQVAVDQWGDRWQIRGLGNRSAANGNYDANSAFGAVLLILAQGETPSPSMMQTTREVVADFRRIFPGAKKLADHGTVKQRFTGESTECPGPRVRHALRSGRFAPREDLDMTERELRQIIREELDRVCYDDRSQPNVRRSLSGVILAIDAQVAEIRRRMRKHD